MKMRIINVRFSLESGSASDVIITTQAPGALSHSQPDQICPLSVPDGYNM